MNLTEVPQFQQKFTRQPHVSWMRSYRLIYQNFQKYWITLSSVFKFALDEEIPNCYNLKSNLKSKSTSNRLHILSKSGSSQANWCANSWWRSTLLLSLPEVWGPCFELSSLRLLTQRRNVFREDRVESHRATLYAETNSLTFYTRETNEKSEIRKQLPRHWTTWKWWFIPGLFVHTTELKTMSGHFILCNVNRCHFNRWQFQPIAFSSFRNFDLN